MNNKNLNKLITEALAIEAEEARYAGAIGYMARFLVQATLPHSSVSGNEFERSNGYFTLNVLAPSKIGIPYGSIPRLLIAWISTEAVKTKRRELVLGESLSSFMRELDLAPTGGRWGSITRLKTQMTRLFSSSITAFYDNKGDAAMPDFALKNIKMVSEANLWWEPKHPDQAALWQSTLLLDHDFFDEIINRPVPIDLRALKALKRSPMAIDIYNWLTYRMSYLKKPTEIPWQALQTQFGAGYPMTGQGTRDFKKSFRNHMRKIMAIYQEAAISSGKIGLVLSPSRTHIPPKQIRF